MGERYYIIVTTSFIFKVKSILRSLAFGLTDISLLQRLSFWKLYKNREFLNNKKRQIRKMMWNTWAIIFCEIILNQNNNLKIKVFVFRIWKSLVWYASMPITQYNTSFTYCIYTCNMFALLTLLLISYRCMVVILYVLCM